MLHEYLRERADAVAPISAASSGFSSNFATRRRVRRGIAIIDEEAGLAVVDERPQAADGRGHDRRAARGGLERDQPERLGA